MGARRRAVRVLGTLSGAVAILLLLPAVGAQGVPEQVRVTATGTGDGLVVHWAVVDVDYGPNEEPHVLWSIDGGREESTAATKVGTLVPGEGDLPSMVPQETYVYAATLEDVPPGATVEYRAGSAVRGYTDTFAVRNLPGPGDPVRLVAYADIGRTGVNPDGSSLPDAKPPLVRDLALAQDPDLLVIPGDLAYGHSPASMNMFHRFMEPISARVVTMPVMGNHEWDEDTGLEYQSFLASYVLPGNEHEFLFRAGPVTFVGLNSDRVCQGVHSRSYAGATVAVPCHLGVLDEELLDLAEDLLAEASSDATPWTVVYFHHPPYSFGQHGSDLGLRGLWGPLLDRYGVDLVITGHDHLYSRSLPVSDAAPAGNGSEYTKGSAPVYVVAGGGGRPLYAIPDDEEPPAWWAYGEEVHHVVVVEANATTLWFAGLRAGDGSVMDEFRIVAGQPDRGDPPPGATSGASVAAGLLAIAFAVGLRRLR